MNPLLPSLYPEIRGERDVDTMVHFDCFMKLPTLKKLSLRNFKTVSILVDETGKKIRGKGPTADNYDAYGKAFMVR